MGTDGIDAQRVSAFEDVHLAQMIGYLSIPGLKLGLLINFKRSQQNWKRIVN